MGIGALGFGTAYVELSREKALEGPPGRGVEQRLSEAWSASAEGSEGGKAGGFT